MDLHRIGRRSAFGVLAFALLAAPLGAAAGNARKLEIRPPETTESQKQALEHRQARLIGDAVAALDATREAVAALEQQDSKRALEQLEIATGKLDLLVARHPEAAALPIAVRMTTADVLGTNEDIEAIIENAEEALEDGRVQLARRLLAPLASEIDIETTKLPLAVFPDALRLVAPLVDAGRLDEAAVALQAALGTLIVEKEIVPLPVLRAELLLDVAAAKLDAPPVVKPANEENSKSAAEATPAELLAAAREQLHRADLLGYGKAKKTYPDLVERLEKLESTLESKSRSSWKKRFGRLRESLSELGSSLLD